MEFALFLGCTIPARLNQYESASRAVLERLGVGIVDIGEFNCCGYPLRSISFKTFVLSSARNLALAARRNLDVMTPCKCCYGSLKKADHLMKDNVTLRKEINSTLAKEGLTYEGGIEVRHLLSVLFHEVGIESIRDKLERKYEGLRVAAHYGCHVLRPSQVVAFDDPVAPSIFDELVEVTGAESIDWATQLECCGAPVWGINDELSMDLTKKKIRDGRESGADYLCSACPYCHIQFDAVQQSIRSRRSKDHRLPSILYPQLLGLSMGLDREILGLDMNQIPLDGIEGFLADKPSACSDQPTEEAVSDQLSGKPGETSAE